MLTLRIGKYGNYWGNDYLSSNGLNMEQMQVNATYIFNSLSDSGFSINAIAGMLGNLQTESSINPGRWEGNNVGVGPGYGLVQWTPYTNYINWATSNGYPDPSVIDGQLARINFELENGLQWIPTEKYPMTFEEFKLSTLPPDYLADVFIKNYERPLNPNQPIRGEQAIYWYEFLGGITPLIPKTKKSKFKWVLYARKLRNHNF